MFALPDLGLGGAQVVAVRLAELLRDRGDRVVIATLGPVATDHVAIPDDVGRLVVAPTVGRRGVTGVVTKNIRRARSLRRSLREWRPDVIVAFVDSTNLFMLLATRGLGIPVVVSERVDPREHSVAPYQRLLRRVLYRRASALVVQTERVAEWARSVVRPSRVRVIANPVPLPTAVAKPRHPPTIVASGRLVEQKGFDLLIDALAMLGPGALGDWQVEILGEGECREALQQRLSASGLEAHVTLVGQVGDVDAHLERASIFVLSSRFEGFPNALSEAMAWGVPSVSFDCPTGPRELLVDGITGRLVPPEDVAALSRAIGDLMRAPAERARLGAASRRSLDRYAPALIADAWDDLIEGATAHVRHRWRS